MHDNYFTSLPDLHEVPVFFPHGTHLIWISEDGEITRPSLNTLAAKLASQVVMLCHRRWSAARAGIEIDNYLDVMELFAFVRPARFVLPTPKGLAQQLGLARPQQGEDMAAILPQIAFALLDELAGTTDEARAESGKIASMMTAGGWKWGPYILIRLGLPQPPAGPPDSRHAAIWYQFDSYIDYTPQAELGNQPILPDEARQRLAEMLGGNAERRLAQADYAAAVAAGFDRHDAGPDPAIVLAEAGTGTGKTLGYLAPATLWAEKNGSAVWISTYTRTLQHQIANELTRLYTDADVHESEVVIRKGRENYLCLLNLEEALAQMPGYPRHAVVLGLMARWASATRDGDLTGTSFPAWLLDLFGHSQTIGLSDRRGECIHSACSHYNRCFVEKSARKAKQASIVVTNHALVMVQSASGSKDQRRKPTRYVFDEGHHIFDAADSAFSAYLSGCETAELRHWVRGTEDGRRGRARGLKRRLEDLVTGDRAAQANIEEALETARVLPGQGWESRLSAGQPLGVGETFFMHLRAALYSRVKNPDSIYDLQSELYPAPDSLVTAAKEFTTALASIAEPLTRLSTWLIKYLDNHAEDMDTNQRNRLEGVIRGLELRAGGPLLTWQTMLTDLNDGPRDGFVDWIQIKRLDGQDRDVGLARHWLDPTIPFTHSVLDNAHGVIVTSAALQDYTVPKNKALTNINDDEKSPPAFPAEHSSIALDSWQLASALTGALHLNNNPLRFSFSSPFDYAKQTRILVVNDLDRNNPESTASAMAALMIAAGGGGLGLFTAIRRLRAIYPTLITRLDAKNLPLYAQHVDKMNLQTLLAMFREEPRSCLLGTDAVRDGIDVPGEALRLIIFDRMPWPRRDILFTARAKWQGHDTWTDYQTRLKLRQAFGRLIRHSDDRGVFVMLDSRLPSRMTSAFPPDVEIHRIGISEAIRQTETFFI